MPSLFFLYVKREYMCMCLCAYVRVCDLKIRKKLNWSWFLLAEGNALFFLLLLFVRTGLAASVPSHYLGFSVFLICTYICIYALICLFRPHQLYVDVRCFRFKYNSESKRASKLVFFSSELPVLSSSRNWIYRILHVKRVFACLLFLFFFFLFALPLFLFYSIGCYTHGK